MKKNSVRIYNQLSKPFGPLSINYFYPIHVEDKKAYPIKINSRRYKTASNYIYSNGVITTPMYNNIIANANPADIKKLFNEFIIEDKKNMLNKSLVEAVEHAIKRDRDFSIKLTNAGGKTLRYNNDMSDEIDMFLEKNYVNVLYKYIPYTKNSITFEDKLHEAYNVAQVLIGRMRNGSDLSEYIGKSVKDILGVSLNYPSKDSVKILYDAGKIEPYVYNNINTPENIVYIIRANELKNLQTRLKDSECDRIFDAYVNNILKVNYPKLDEINYNIAKKQQFQSLSESEYSDMVSRVCKLVKSGKIKGLKYDSVKIPTNKEIEDAVEDVKKLRFKESLSPEEDTIVAPYSDIIKQYMVDYMIKFNKNLTTENIVSKLKENMKTIFDLKFENNDFKYLLSLTGNMSIKMPDLYKKDNYVGEYLEEMRGKNKFDFIPLTKDNVNVYMENNKFLLEWVKERTLDVCNTLVMLKGQFVPEQKIIKPFISAVLENLYNGCENLPVKLSYDAPLYFKNIVGTFSKRMDTDIGDKAIKFLYNYILQLVFTIIDTTNVKSLDQFNKNIALSQHFLTVKPNMICVKSALVNIIEKISIITGEEDYDRYLLIAVDILYNQKKYIDTKLQDKIKDLEKEISKLVDKKKDSDDIYEIESQIDNRVIELNDAKKELRRVLKKTAAEKKKKDEEEVVEENEDDIEDGFEYENEDEDVSEEILFSFPYKRSSAAYKRSKAKVQFEGYIPSDEQIIDNLRVLPDDKFYYVMRKLSENPDKDEKVIFKKAILEYKEPEIIIKPVYKLSEKYEDEVVNKKEQKVNNYKDKKYTNLEKKIDKQIKKMFSSSKSQIRFNTQIQERLLKMPPTVQNRVNFFAPHCAFIIKRRENVYDEVEEEVDEEEVDEEEVDDIIEEEDFVPEKVAEQEEREGKAEEDIEIAVEDFGEIEF